MFMCAISEQTCGRHEVFLECGSACPETCDTINSDEILICVPMCVSGCFCRKGFVRNAEGQCIRRWKCPTQCGNNEEYTTCGSACPPNCENFPENVECPEICLVGCFCKPGFVLNAENECILRSECPEPEPLCGKNEDNEPKLSECLRNNSRIVKVRCQFGIKYDIGVADLIYPPENIPVHVIVEDSWALDAVEYD
ncbi:serine protease inhibitor swm-1-like [Sabethes cyaneus]|uniref:serine protease inhibitor swm-1-like n=1 Tax=Sabethes cyaneus TaxID=53552 RepID=UPI00237E528A|nr:serine protease inhibitor swm-1-like [Sabethes cyaneus]